jgi:hypothetical protein
MYITDKSPYRAHNQDRWVETSSVIKGMQGR